MSVADAIDEFFTPEGQAAWKKQLEDWWDSLYPNVEVEWNEPCIYVFSVPPYIKVGYSSKVYHRRDQLASGHGKPLLKPPGMPRKCGGDLIAAWPGTRKDERPAHRELADFHVIGEWFRHTPEVDEWIERKVAAAREARAA